MTPPRQTRPSTFCPRSLSVLAAGTLLGLVGCTTDAEPDLVTSARSDGPLAATPGAAGLGLFRVGGSGHLAVALVNSSRSDIVIRNISLIPPDPYAPQYTPPAPCLPPDPYRSSGGLPPDPYHNPPGDLPPSAYLTTRLIIPCVKPGGSTTLDVGFSAINAGGFAAGIQISYVTGDGQAFALTVPATACAVR